MAKSKGLGDDIEKFITKPLGIKKVVDTVAKAVDKPCGCEERKSLLNRWFPKKGNLTQDEFEFQQMFFETYNGSNLKSEEERDMLYKIYNQVNRTNEKPSGCSACLRGVIENLRDEFQRYV